jgi:hypothetical protein
MRGFRLLFVTSLLFVPSRRVTSSPPSERGGQQADGDTPRRGRAQASILQAEGFSQALAKILEVAQGLDANTMSLQYLDTLRAIGASESTKFVIPMEFSSLLGKVSGLAEDSFGNGRDTKAKTPKK